MTAATAAPGPAHGETRPRPRRGADARAPSALGREAGDLVHEPAVLATHRARGPRAPRRSRVPRGSAPGRPGHRDRSSACASRCSPPSAAASARRRAQDRATTLLDVADALLREEVARAALARLRPPRADDRRRSRSAPGSACGRPPPARATGSPWTRSPTSRAAASSPRPTAGRSSNSSCTRRPAGSGVSSGSTIATIPHVDRRARSRARASPPTPSPIVAELIGDAEPDVQKALSWALRSMSVVDDDGDDRVPPPRGAPRRATPTTATVRGSSATRSRSCRPPRRTSSGRRRRRHPHAGRARHRPPAPPPPPRRSPASGVDGAARYAPGRGSRLMPATEPTLPTLRRRATT